MLSGGAAAHIASLPADDWPYELRRDRHSLICWAPQADIHRSTPRFKVGFQRTRSPHGDKGPILTDQNAIAAGIIRVVRGTEQIAQGAYGVGELNEVQRRRQSGAPLMR